MSKIPWDILKLVIALIIRNWIFEHLSNLKKELGLPVGFKTETEKKEEERARRAGWDPVNRRPIRNWLFKII